MDRFVEWFNRSLEGATPGDALAMAGVAHLYFECIHPFEDGNGRIGRAIAEKAARKVFGPAEPYSPVENHQQAPFELLPGARELQGIAERKYLAAMVCTHNGGGTCTQSAATGSLWRAGTPVQSD